MDYKKLNEYRYIESKELKDIKSEGVILKHKKSGARIALVMNEDENKVFSIAFRTPPSDSTGVPHIMEHSVLCGSRNFPVKDPFVELAKGSLNTFLNAMTYPDKTVYPVASCNDQDFRNLMHVYLDAVFYPNIYEYPEIMRQEGWSYSLDSEDGELSINGVVYNEMKGAFSSPDDSLSREVFNSLYPDTCYGVESGGDPDVIPTLTYEQFLDFHRRYYHPANSYIYLYGDMDYEEILKWMDREYLNHFDEIDVPSEIGVQKPFEEVRRTRIQYPVSENESLENHAFLTYNMVVGDVLDSRLLQAMEILDYGILSAPGAPIETALLEAGIGTDISGSFENEVRQPFVSITARNASEEDEEQFVEIIRNTLQKIVDEGIDERVILAGVNYYDFRVREAEYGRIPKGLMYDLMMLGSWIYSEDDPFRNLEVLDNYAWLKKQAGTGYFEGLIKRYLLDNPHGSIVSAVPEKGLQSRRDRELAEKLQKYKNSLSKEDISNIVNDTAALREYQEAEETQENLEKIPILRREDLKRSVRGYSNHEEMVGKIKLVSHEYETNGIAYIHMLYDLQDVEEALRPAVAILQSVLGLIDTEHFTYGDLFNEINLHTGGIGSSLEILRKQEMGTAFTPYFEWKGKALYEYVPEFFRMLGEILQYSKLDDSKRIQEIILQEHTQLQARFMGAGHGVAVSRGSANQGGPALFKEQTEGIAYYRVLEKLIQGYEEYQEDLILVLKGLMGRIFTPEKLLVSFTGDPAFLPGLRTELENWQNVWEAQDTIPAASFLQAAGRLKDCLSYDEIHRKEGYSCASKVQYVARVGNFRDKGLVYTGAMHALRTILGYEYLWEKIRVTGGAYGCMSSFQRTGDAYFVSYRDPHLGRTQEVFKEIPAYLRSFEADERKMTKFIIGAVSDLDQPMGADTQGIRSMTAYLTGITVETLQRERNELLDAVPEDIRALGDQVEAVLDTGILCVVGGEDKIKENQELFDITKSLL